jgi:hypothetical protein
MMVCISVTAHPLSSLHRLPVRRINRYTIFIGINEKINSARKSDDIFIKGN